MTVNVEAAMTKSRAIRTGLMILGLIMLLTGASFAGPVVQNSTISNGQITIGGTGFISPVTVQLNANLGSALSQGTYRLVVVAGGKQTATTVTAPGIISGLINADGTIQTGTGFSSSLSQGTYILAFPIGTFNGPTPPVAVVTPFYLGGNAMNFDLYSTTYPGDGSATISFNFSPIGQAGAQVPFTFIVVNGH
jgi:hypothetical protein